MVRSFQPLVAGLLLALAAGGVALGLNYIVPAAAESSDAPEPRPALPDIIFADGSNMPVHVAQYAGQVLIINFWASWCGPCIKEMTFLDRLQGDFRGAPLTVMAVSEDQGGIATARQFYARQKLTYLKPFADPGNAVAQRLGVRGLPTSIIVDRHGRVVQQVTGPYQWDSPQIVSRLKYLLSEP